MSKGQRQCRNCNGSGKVVLACSWCLEDGYRLERCGICRGSGEEPKGYRAWPGHAAWQQKARSNIAEWGGMKPPVNA